METPFVRLIGGGNRMAREGPIPHDDRTLKVLERRRTRYAQKKASKVAQTGKEALQRGGKIFEEMILHWFRWQGLDPDRRRELYFRGLQGSNGCSETREIDGFFPGLNLLMEARLSVQGMRALKKEHHQLLTSLEVLRHVEAEAQPLVVFVKVGPEPIESHPRDLLEDMRLNVGALERTWSEGLRVDGWLNVPRVVFDIFELRDWMVQHSRWDLHPSIVTEAQLFAEERWMWRQRAYEQRAKLHGNGKE